MLILSFDNTGRGWVHPSRLGFNSTIIEDTLIPVKIGLSIGKTTILKRFPRRKLVQNVTTSALRF
jgi:hypothetical protein